MSSRKSSSDIRISRGLSVVLVAICDSEECRSLGGGD